MKSINLDIKAFRKGNLFFRKPLRIWDFKPAIKAKAVVDTIFSGSSFRYTSSFFDSTYFNNLYILPSANNNLGANPSNAVSQSLWVYASASQNTEFDDSQTHYIVFAEMSPDSFFNRKLAKYFDEYTLKEMFTKVNSSYECGSTYRPGNKAPFVTILPLFDQFKRNQTEDQFLQGIFNDIVKSQNQYFKKPTICMVYSSKGFPNRRLFEEHWYMVVKQLTFSGYAKFIAE